MFERRKKKTIVVVIVSKYTEYAKTYDYWMTDDEWRNKQTDFDLKGKHYTWINSDTILFIKKEKGKD